MVSLHVELFVPEGAHLNFVKSAFDGQLPAPYAEGEDAMRIAHSYFNDENKEDTTSTWTLAIVITWLILLLVISNTDMTLLRRVHGELCTVPSLLMLRNLDFRTARFMYQILHTQHSIAAASLTQTIVFFGVQQPRIKARGFKEKGAVKAINT